jgi:hypothetical protein
VDVKRFGALARSCASEWSTVSGLAFSLLFAGIQQVEKYLGLTGVALYLMGGIAILLTSRRYLIPRFVGRVTDKLAWILVLGTLAGLLLMFFVVYPVADSGVIGGGSDSDDALNLATKALLNHQYPYDIETYLGAPATYLPGSLLLAVPFVMLGNAAYQNVFWLALLILATNSYLKDIRQAVLLCWITLLCSSVLQSLVTGAELLASSIYMVLFVLFAMKSCLAERKRWFRWVAAALLGIGLSSRGNYLLLIPVICSTTIQRVGWKETAGYAAVTGGVFLAVTLPFWLYDPQTFWAACVLEQNSLATVVDPIVPHASLALPLASALFALGLSLRRMKNWQSDLLSNCAYTQAFPVLTMFILFGIPNLEFGYTRYGMHFLFFGALASWTGFIQSRQAA